MLTSLEPSRKPEDHQGTRRPHTKYIFPKKNVLDNEASSKYKEVIKINWMEHEIVTPNMNHRNFSEMAIQKFKNTFVGILRSLPN